MYIVIPSIGSVEICERQNLKIWTRLINSLYDYDCVHCIGWEDGGIGHHVHADVFLHSNQVSGCVRLTG